MGICKYPQYQQKKKEKKSIRKLNRMERDQAKSPYVIAALGSLSFGGLLLPKKRLKLIPLPRFFSSGGEEAFTGTLVLLATLPLVCTLAVLVLVLVPLTSLGLVGAFSVLSDFVAGDRFSVPGVVTVRLGLWVVLRPLVAEGVDGASEGWGWVVGMARLGEVVRWVELAVVVFVWLLGGDFSRWILVAEGRRETTGLFSGGETDTAAGGGL